VYTYIINAYAIADGYSMSNLHSSDSISVKDLDVSSPDQIIFIKNKKTGKFLRGAIFIPWVKKWSNAWPATPKEFIGRFNSGSLKKFGIYSIDDVIVVTSPSEL
jgi:hypothetical protein